MDVIFDDISRVFHGATVTLPSAPPAEDPEQSLATPSMRCPATYQRPLTPPSSPPLPTSPPVVDKNSSVALVDTAVLRNVDTTYRPRSRREMLGDVRMGMRGERVQAIC